jgi:hypothetical protein
MDLKADLKAILRRFYSGFGSGFGRRVYNEFEGEFITNLKASL